MEEVDRWLFGGVGKWFRLSISREALIKIGNFVSCTFGVFWTIPCYLTLPYFCVRLCKWTADTFHSPLYSQRETQLWKHVKKKVKNLKFYYLYVRLCLILNINVYFVNSVLPWKYVKMLWLLIFLQHSSLILFMCFKVCWLIAILKIPEVQREIMVLSNLGYGIYILKKLNQFKLFPYFLKPLYWNTFIMLLLKRRLLYFRIYYIKALLFVVWVFWVI